MLVIFSIFILFFNVFVITNSKISLEKESFDIGEKISGNYNIFLRDGELIPADTLVKVSFDGQTKEITLGKFIEQNKLGVEEIQGNFYLAGTNLSGDGSGYGFPGQKVLYPDVYFQLRILEASQNQTINQTNQTNQTQFNETEFNVTSNETINNETLSNETIIDENITIEENQTSEFPKYNQTIGEIIGEDNSSEEQIIEEPVEPIIEEPTEPIVEEPIEEPTELPIEEPTEPPIVPETPEEIPDEPVVEQPSEPTTEPTEPIESTEPEPTTKPETEISEVASTFSDRTTIETTKDVNEETKVELSTRYLRDYSKDKKILLYDDTFGRVINAKCSAKETFMIYLLEGEETFLIPGSVHTDTKELDGGVIQQGCSETCSIYTTDYSEIEYGFGKDYSLNQGSSISLDLSTFELSSDTNGEKELSIELIYQNEIISLDKTKILVGEINETNITNMTNVMNITEIDYSLIKEDLRYDLIIDSVELENETKDLVVVFHHDYDKKLDVYFLNPENISFDYIFNETKLKEGEYSELRIKNYNPGDYFEIKLGDESEIIGFGDIPEYNFNLDIKDSNNKTIDATIEFYDAENNKKSFNAQEETEKIQRGQHKIVIKPEKSEIKSIVFENINLDRNIDKFIKIDYPNLEDYSNFVQIYAIDPSEFNFTEATVTGTAVGDILLKCKDWNFTEQKCTGEWIKIQDLIIGEDYSFTLTPEDPAYSQVNISQCKAEDMASSPGQTFAGACDYTDGSALIVNGGTTETHTFGRSSGGTNPKYGGVQINSTNTSITNCGSIINVTLCYEWWYDSGATANCYISVDANNGASWTSVSTNCPGASANPGVTCANVTSSESWACSTFFGTSATGAVAKSGLSGGPTGSGVTSTATWDILMFNVTYELLGDNAPTVTLSSPADNYYNSTSQYVNLTLNASVTDDRNLVNCSLWHNYTGTWQINQTQTVTGTSNVTNFTLLNLTNKTFIWNIRCFDNNSNSSFASANRTIKLNWSAGLSWNQSSLNIGSIARTFSKTGNATINSMGPNANVRVYNISGNGTTFITATPSNVGSMTDGGAQQILFNCTPPVAQTVGFYTAIFKVNSTENTTGSNITVNCTVLDADTFIIRTTKDKTQDSWFGEIIINATINNSAGEPVTGASVNLTVTPPTGRFVDARTFALLDNGVFPDATANDGIYAIRYDISLNGSAYTNGTMAMNVTASKTGFNSSFNSSDSFTTVPLRRWWGSDGIEDVYANYKFIQNGGIWTINITNFKVMSNTTATNITVKLPILNHASVSGLVGQAGMNPGSRIENGNVLVFYINTTNGGSTLLNFSFNASSDLILTQNDRYRTQTIGLREGKNGFTIFNSHMQQEIFGIGLAAEGGETAMGPYATGENVGMKVVGDESQDNLSHTIDCMERVGIPNNGSTGTMQYDTCVDCNSYYEWNIHWMNPQWNTNYKHMPGEITEATATQIKLTFYDDNSTDQWASTNKYNVTKALTYYSNKKYYQSNFTIKNIGATALNTTLIWGREPWLYTGGNTDLNDNGATPTVYPVTVEEDYTWAELTSNWIAFYDSAAFYATAIIFPTNTSTDSATLCAIIDADHTPLGTVAGQNLYPWSIDHAAFTDGYADDMFCEWRTGNLNPGSQASEVFYHWGGSNTSAANIIGEITNDANTIAGENTNPSPIIISSAPANLTTYNNNRTVNFNFTATDELNTTFLSWIYLDGVYNQSNSSTKNNTITTFVISGITYGYHNWSIIVSDGDSNTTNNSYFWINDTIVPAVVLSNPPNLTTFSNLRNINFNFTATDNANLTLNCSVRLDGVTNQTNTTTYNNTLTNFQINGITYGYHNWSINCSDGKNVNVSETRYFWINDTIAPVVFLNSPIVAYNSSSLNVIFNCSATDSVGLANISLWLNSTGTWVKNITNITTGTSNSTLNTRTFVDGIYKWSCSANDSSGNQNISFTENRTFIVDTTAPQWSNNATSPSTPATYNITKNYQFNVTWTDSTIGISTVIIENNFTGVLTNYSTNSLGSGIYSYNITNLNVSGYVWRMYANDSLGNINSTAQWNYVVGKANATNLFSVNQTTYAQGLEEGQGYDVYIPFQARLLDGNGNTINSSTCYVVNNETEDNVTLIFNSSSGNYTGNMTTAWLYNLTKFNASCYNSNYNEAINTTTAGIWVYLYLWDWYNLTYSTGNIYTSDWLRKIPTTGNVKTITNESVLAVGENPIKTVYLYGPGTNGSMSRDFEIYGMHTIRMNVSVNNTSCKPYICTEIINFDLNVLIKQCGEPQTISANTPTVIEHNITGDYTVRQNEFLGLELYLNCSSSVNEKTIIYYNYSGMPANLEAHNAVPSKITSNVVKRIQLESSYVVGPNSTANVSRKTWIQFNNTGALSKYQSYHHISQLNEIYSNVVVPNTVYIYNSTDNLWASDNSSAGAPNAATVFSSTNVILWLTEIIPAFTAINETVQRKEKDAIKDNETLITNNLNKKEWNINVLTIYNEQVTIENVTVWTNYSTYGANDDWVFDINVTNSSGTFNITSEITKFTNNKTIYFPLTHLSEVTYNILAEDTILPNITFVFPTPNLNEIIIGNWVTINVSVMSNVALDSCILNWDGINESMTMVGTGTNVICWSNKTSLLDGNYPYKVYANDSVGNWNVSETRNVTIDTVALNVTLISPENGNMTTNKDINFICNVTDNSQLSNITFYWNYTGVWEANGTTSISGVSNNTTNIRTGLNNGEILWNCYACNELGSCNFSIENWTVEVRSTPPSVIIISPIDETFADRIGVPLSINATDSDGIDSKIAEVVMPNGTVINLTLSLGQQGDNFDTDTMNVDWIKESSSIGPGQTCVADIDTTFSGKAFTSITGNGAPNTDTLCTIISNKVVYGDFDANVSFNITGKELRDRALTFQITEIQSSASAIKLAYISLTNWSNYNKRYEIFTEDGITSGYLATRDSDDTNGKMRIMREGNNFSFYTWNNSDSSWILENYTELLFNHGLYFSFESESTYPEFGTINVTWEDFNLWDNNYSGGMFNETSLIGVYNVTLFVNDSYGALNNTEKTNFTIEEVNNIPTKPYILTPAIDEIIHLNQLIVWSQVVDEEGDLLRFNITLLNPNGTENATIVSDYGNSTSTSYLWNTTEYSDGNYSLRVTVYENETIESGENSFTIGGNIIIDNTLPIIEFFEPTENSSSIANRNYILINVTVSDLYFSEARLSIYNSSFDLVRTENVFLGNSLFNITNLADGIYYFNATAWDLVGNEGYSETRNVTLFTSLPPSVEILYPKINTIRQGNDYISIMTNITDIEGINSTIAQIVYPNSTIINLSLIQSPQRDNFDMNSMDIIWKVDNETIGPGQTCVADIDTTVTDKAYTSISGDGTPNTDTYCGLVITQQVIGDFDINVSFNITAESGIDYAMLLDLTETPYPMSASKDIFVSLGNWTGYGRTYDIFVNDGNTSEYILEKTTNDTYGKIRIKRIENNFTFYTWNNSDSSWIQEIEYEINVYPGLFISLGSEAGYPEFGSIDVTWDDLETGISPLLYVGRFADTSAEGNYNLTIIAEDIFETINDTEKTNFTIQNVNDAPSTPYILAPAPNSFLNGDELIIWSEVYDLENDTLQFNITLLNPDETENATIVSDYGNSTSTSYLWNTTEYSDGNYSLRITVYENDTFELYSVEQNLMKNFTIDNTLPVIEFFEPTLASGSGTNKNNLLINVSVFELFLDSSWVDIYLYNSSFNLINESEILAGNGFYNYTGLEDGIYYFNATAWDIAGNEGYSETRNVTIDRISPTIEFIDPTDVNGTYSRDYTSIKVNQNDTNNGTAFIDFNNSLVLWLRLNNETGESETLVKDWGTYENDGTPSESNYISSGRFGGAFEFNGVNATINLGNDSSLNPTDAITLEGWIKLNSYNTIAGAVLFNKDTDTGGRAYNFGVDGNGALWCQINGGGTFAGTPGEVPLDEWHYIAMTGNSANGFIFYLDGNSVGTASWETIASVTTDTVIGMYQYPGYEDYFNGTIDEARIWNRALSEQEIKSSYNVGLYPLENNFTDLSNGNYTFIAHSQDLGGNVNQTDLREIELDKKGCVGATDIFICGEIITESCTMNTNLTASGTCFAIGADDLVVDGNGYLIEGGGILDGIYMNNRNNIILKNFIIDNFGYAIHVGGSSNILIENNTLQNINSDGIRVDGGSGNNITNNIMSSVSTGSVDNFAIRIGNGIDSPNYYIANNTISSSGNCIGMYSLGITENNNLTCTTTAIFLETASADGSIANNNTIDTAKYGIYVGSIAEVDNCNITNNIIKNIYGDNSYSVGISLYGLMNRVENNYIEDTRRGLDLWDAIGEESNIIINNTIINSETSGIYIDKYFASSSSNNLFINNTNNLGYSGLDIKFNSSTNSQNISSSGNMGWWPLLESDGSDASIQSNTAWYNGTFGGKNADGSINLTLKYWYNETNGITTFADCANIVEPGEHALEGDINASGVCFNVTVSNVVFDCSGYTIFGTANNSVGINLGAVENTTIKNCTFINNMSTPRIDIFEGIRGIFGDSNTTVYNNTFLNNTRAIRLENFLVGANVSNNELHDGEVAIILFGGDSSYANVTVANNNATNFNTSWYWNAMVNLRLINENLYVYNNYFLVDDSPPVVEMYEVQNVEVYNNTFIGGALHQNFAIIRSTNNHLFNNTIISGTDGVFISGSSNNLIEENNITGQAHHNIILYVHPTVLGNVTNNTIKNNNLTWALINGVCSGAEEGSTANNSIYNNYIEGNYVAHNFATGINMAYGDEYASQNTIINNVVEYNGVSGIVITLDDNIVKNNIVKNNVGTGITISGINNTIQNNTAFNNTVNGIIFCTSGIFENNNATSNGGTGIESSCVSNAIMTNNTASDNNKGFDLSVSSNFTLIESTAINNTEGGIFVTSCENSTVYNNIIQENGIADIRFILSSESNCNNNISENLGSGNRQILYYNGSATLENEINLSELILCNADNFVINNIAVAGSDILKNNGVFSYYTDNSNLSNLTSNDNYEGFHVSLSTNLNIENSIFLNNLLNGILIHIGSDNCTINNVTSNFNGAGGIEIDGQNTRLYNSTFDSNPQQGIYFGGYCANSVVFGSNISNSSTGIAFTDSNITVENNTLDRNGYGVAIIGMAGSGIILGNVINSSSIIGITSQAESGNFNISQNNLSNNTIAIQIKNQNLNFITDNIITGSSDKAIHLLEDSDNNTFSRNIITESNYDIYIEGVMVNAVFPFPSSTPFYPDNNLFLDSIIDGQIYATANEENYNENTFLNVTHDTENVTVENGTLYFKWYLDAYVKYENNTAVDGAFVTGYSDLIEYSDAQLESNFYTYETNPYTEAASYGTWSIIDNKLNIVDGSGSSVALGFLNNDTYYNSTYKKVDTNFTISSTGLNDWSSAVTVIDYQTSSSDYYSCWQQLYSGVWYLSITKCNDLGCGSYSTIAIDAGNTFSTDTEYQMIFERDGNNFNCTIPGVSSVAGIDSSWNGGYEGVADYYANVTYDNTNITWNLPSNLAFNKTTNSSGYIERQNVTEYYQTNAGRTFYTNYSVNATKGAQTSQTESINLTGNYIVGENGPVNLTLNPQTGCIGATTNFTCGDTITESCVFDTNLTCSDSMAFTINTNNIIIDGAGHAITGSSSTNGFYGTSIDNVTIKNITVIGFTGSGIYFGQGLSLEYKSNNNTILDAILEGNTVGAKIQGDYNFINNSLFENNYVGCDILFENNTVQQSIFDGNNYSFGFSTGFTETGGITTQGNLIIDTISIDASNNDIYSETKTDDEINTLLNVSFNESSVYFEKGILDIQWYLDTYVNYTNGTAAEGANVSIYDLNNILRHSALTNSSGYILRQNVSEYFQNSTNKYYYTNYSVNASKGTAVSQTESINLTGNYIVGENGPVNLTIDDCSINFTMSENLTNGVHFGFIDGLPVLNYNASGNNGTEITRYNLQLEINGSCKANIYAKGWGALTSGLNTIELGNESFCYNNTNSSVPGIDCINMTTDYQLIGYNLSSGNYSYLKFYLDIPSGQAAGNYDNLIGIKANITTT